MTDGRTTAIRHPGPASARSRTVCCRVVSGAGAGAELLLDVGRRALVGAARDADLRLDDPMVSSTHAELELTPEGVRVRDLGSTNGTLWGSTRLTEAVVPVGAVLTLGDTRLALTFVHSARLASSSRDSFGELAGQSPVMRNLFATLEMAAPSDATIVIEGESGTGKELCARAIHEASSRAARPFVVVDCGAVSTQLIDSQLFGHVRGAFTGAEAKRDGAFLRAHGGTIFLDEIGELPLDVQAKLLRVLEDRSIQPLGSDERAKIDVRVVAATHRRLSQRVAQGHFREDLWHRLAVVQVTMPPLRERLDDIPSLVAEIYRQRHVEPGPITGPNLRLLQEYGWPGNVRELRNVIERAIVLSAGGKRFEDLELALIGEARAPGAPVDLTLPYKDAKQKVVDAFEARYVAGLLAELGGDVGRAAERSGLSRKHLRRLLAKQGLDAGDE